MMVTTVHRPTHRVRVPLAATLVLIIGALACSSSAASDAAGSEVNRDAHPVGHELLGDIDAPRWAAALEAPWPSWTKQVREQPTVIRFGYEPHKVDDRFEHTATRISRLEQEASTDTEARLTYVRREREVEASIAELNEEGGIAEVLVRFDADHARVLDDSKEAQKDSPVAGNTYLCRVSGNRVRVERLTPEPQVVTDSPERMLVWRAVRPLVQGQILAQALAAKPHPVNRELDLPFSQLAPLIGADTQWYTESVEARLRGTTTVEQRRCAMLDLAVRARVAGQGGTIQTVDLVAKVALDLQTARAVRTEISMSTHIESASLNAAVSGDHPDIHGEHRVTKSTIYRPVPE